MIDKRDDEAIDVECPECGAIVRTTGRLARKGQVRCPRGHEVALMEMLFDPGDQNPR